MSMKFVLKLSVLLAVSLLFAAGCTKKPVEDTSNQVPQTQMQPEQVPQVSEQPVSETPQSDTSSMQSSSSSSTMASLQRVHFDFDQYVLTTEARDILKQDADYLTGKGVRVQIEGHCDERGSDEYNLALGEKRALAVKNYLVSLGVPADRMSIISYGEEIPLVMGHDEQAWAQNRRAEFKELN